jgi:Flp pilus assembly protein TadD
MVMIRYAGLAATVLVTFFLSACAGFAPVGLTTSAIPPPSDERPQDEPLALAKLHYVKGDYGLAERYFRAAVEANPKSSEAWLGLAAAYDRLRRFELAERAYNHLLATEGYSAPVLNNLAYHNMLRGDLVKARALLLDATQKDPANAVIAGNLRLLDTWKGEPIANIRG